MRYALRQRWVRILTSYVLALGGVVVSVYLLVPKTSELRAIRSVLNDSDTWLLLVAGGLELLSIWFYALTTRQLTQRHKERISKRFILAVTVAATAIGNSLPFGAGVTAVYAFRKLESRGVSRKDSVLAVGATNAVAVATLALLAALSALLGGSTVLNGGDIVILLGVGALAFLLVAYVRLAVRSLVYVFEVLRGLRRYGFGEARDRARTKGAEVADFELSRADLAFASFYAFLNWFFDLLALLLAVHIVHAHVPLFGVVAAYFVGALAANLPITPGGLGVVEGSLAVALIAFGGGRTTVLAAVLLYRLVSFWIWLPTGWIVHFVMSFFNQRQHRMTVEFVETLVDGEVSS